MRNPFCHINSQHGIFLKKEMGSKRFASPYEWISAFLPLHVSSVTRLETILVMGILLNLHRNFKQVLILEFFRVHKDVPVMS